MVFFADMLVVSFVFMFTYLLRYNLQADAVDLSEMLLQLALILPFFMIAAYIVKPYQGILRHSSLLDALAVIKMVLIGTLAMVVVTLIARRWEPFLVIPWSVIISQFFIGISLLIGFRFLIAIVYQRLIKSRDGGVSLMIYGAGDMGIMTKGVLERDAALRYNLAGFIDDDPRLVHKKVEGLMVFPPEMAFEKIIPEKKVSEIVICIPPGKITKERKSMFVDWCIERNIRVKEVPGVNEWLNGRFFASQIHDVRIEDLLGRDPIVMDDQQVAREIYGKKIMVTGAAGSIGSEISRQLSGFCPESLTLVDQSESSLFELSHEISALKKELPVRIVVADVTDPHAMRQLFVSSVPDIIYHASAYKHVPLMEAQPYEALRTNVGGTKIVADLAVEFGTGKFVMISTDKAVNPTNVMGASKRICELYVNALSQNTGGSTQFIITRFGNVLGSSGSVIPIFRKQIAAGGPVTVTHREVIRYFMTIPEACRLVLEAGFMGRGGEIYLFDMGDPVKIYDLAEKMISLSGFVPHRDVKIIETGHRPGEKLYEELLTRAEETIATHHEKILIAKTNPYDPILILAKIDELVRRIPLESEDALVARMKDIVPEFKSRNSGFESLDTPTADPAGSTS